MLPHRSTTSTWQVSPRVTPSGAHGRLPGGRVRRSGRPAGPGPARTPGAAARARPGGPGAPRARRARPTSAARSLAYAGESRVVQRRVRPVAVPGLAVGERQLHHLGDRVDALGRGRVEQPPGHRGRRAPPALCSSTGPWPQARVLATEKPCHSRRRRLLPGRPRTRPCPRRSPGRRGPRRWSRGTAAREKASTASATKPCAPGPPGGVDLGLPVAAGGRALVDQPLQRARRRPGLVNSAPGSGALPSRSQSCGGRQPVARRTAPRTRADRGATRGSSGCPSRRVADRRREHVGQRPGAVVAQQQQPGVDGAGHGRRRAARSPGTRSRPSERKCSMVAPAGAGPWPHSTAASGRRPSR